MVDIDFETEDLVLIEKWLHTFFSGGKPVKTSKKTLAVMKRLNIIKEEYIKIDKELDEED